MWLEMWNNRNCKAVVLAKNTTIFLRITWIFLFWLLDRCWSPSQQSSCTKLYFTVISLINGQRCSYTVPKIYFKVYDLKSQKPRKELALRDSGGCKIRKIKANEYREMLTCRRQSDTQAKVISIFRVMKLRWIHAWCSGL